MLTFLMIFTSASSQCPPYQCSPSDYNMPKSYCAVSYNHTFFLKPCASGHECDLTTGQCNAAVIAPFGLSYPGENCVLDSDCSSLNCTNKLCVGVASGLSCSAHEDCDPGLRCSKSICSKQIDNTNPGCLTDYDCINSAGCNMIGTSITGTCTQYLSVSIGQSVSDCSGGRSYLCKTTECTKSTLFGTLGVCKLSTSSVQDLPVPCTSYLNCTGFDGSTYYNSKCVCGYNSNGISYCDIFDGDLNGQVYYATWQKALIASGSVCNTASRFSDSCLRTTGFFKSISKATWNFYYYPLLQNNDLCVQQMITYNGYDQDSSILLLLSLGFTLIL